MVLFWVYKFREMTMTLSLWRNGRMGGLAERNGIIDFVADSAAMVVSCGRREVEIESEPD